MSTHSLHEADPLTERLVAAWMGVLDQPRFDNLTVAQILGVIELCKYAIIHQTPVHKNKP
jgi:hypothetical protein